MRNRRAPRRLCRGAGVRGGGLPPAAARLPPCPPWPPSTAGAISTADLDRAVLDLPAERRQPADGDLLAWYERIARELAVQAILVAEARQAGLDQGPDFERAREEARRQAVVAVFLEKDLPPVPVPSRQEIETYYRDHAKEFQSPAARQTYHLFRRVAPGADPAPVVAEVRRLRERVLAGEDFGDAGHGVLRVRVAPPERAAGLGHAGQGGPGAGAGHLLARAEGSQPAPEDGCRRSPVRGERGNAREDAHARRGAERDRRGAGRTEGGKAAIERLVGAAPEAASFVPTVEELRGAVRGR